MMQAGPRGRINTLASENKEMRNIIEQLTAENRRLRQLEIRQTKALQSYERSEYSLPGILHHHQKQTEGLKEQIKKYQMMSDRHERRSRQLEDELARKNNENETLRKSTIKGGGVDKEAEGLKRRQDEMKQKAEIAEKEVTSLKKHIDNLTKNHRREIATIKKKEKDTLATMVSLQERCKDSTKLLQLREKEANVQSLSNMRRDGGKNLPRTASKSGDRGKSLKKNSDDETKSEVDARIFAGGDGLSPIAEEEEETEVKEQKHGNGDSQLCQENEEDIYQGDFDEDKDEGDNIQTKASVDQLGAKENAVVDAKITPISTEAAPKPTEVPTGRFNDSSNNSTTQQNSETNTDVKPKPATTKRPLKAGKGSNLPPLVAPHPPNKPKEKSTAAATATTKTDKVEATVVPIPSSPAGMRLLDYESRMTKIRQKNQEKMSELRRKLDAKLGAPGRGEGGGEGGVKDDVEKRRKEEYGFKFPYDTLRRRRKIFDDDEVAVIPVDPKEEDENDAEVEAVFTQNDEFNSLDEGVDDNKREAKADEDTPSQDVIDYVMAWNSGRGLTPRTEKNIYAEEDEKPRDSAVDRKRPKSQDRSIHDGNQSALREQETMDKRQDALIKEPVTAESSLQKSTTPVEVEPQETLTWTKAEKLRDWISANGKAEDADAVLDAHVESGPSSRNAQILVLDASHDGENEGKFATEGKRLQPILKASTAELRERNREERRRVNFFQSQWIIEEGEEEDNFFKSL